MEENKINNIEVIEEVEETEVETKPKGFGAKVVGGIKKHGKNVAIGIAAVVAIGAAYCLGAKSSGKDDEEPEDAVEDVDVYDVEFTEVNEAE